MAKWIIGIIIIALLGGALWYSGVITKMMPSPAPAPVAPAPVATTTPAAVAPQPENGMAATNDASDTALAQDTAAVDTQIQGLTTDNASVDSSVNDKVVAQSY